MNNKGLTLIELLISAALIIVILIASTSFELYAVNLFNSMRRRLSADGVAAYIMDNISRDFKEATDVDFDPPQGIPGRDRGFYSMSNGDGNHCYLYIYKGIGSRVCSTYIFTYMPESDKYKVQYSPTGDIFNPLILGKVERLWISSYSAPTAEMKDAGVPENTLMRNVITVNIVTRKDLNKPESINNPETVLQATFIPSGMTAQR